MNKKGSKQPLLTLADSGNRTDVFARILLGFVGFDLAFHTIFCRFPAFATMRICHSESAGGLSPPACLMEQDVQKLMPI